MQNNKQLNATILFIFGGTGDLANRKLIPALYNLYLNKQLPQKFIVVGVGRTKFDDIAAYKEKLKDGIEQFSRRKEEIGTQWEQFAELIDYRSMDLTSQSSYSDMRDWVNAKADEWDVKPTLIFYLSLAPKLAPVVAQQISEQEFNAEKKNIRLVFEKPFGKDLQSAQELNKKLAALFDEKQIYRIDHYLGKETVQNILAFRFANAMFEPIWNNHFIDHIQITASETVGVEDRGDYYESSGALRDMVQNHVLQLLCMIAMEPPASFDADEIRNKQLNVLTAIRKMSEKDVNDNAVRGQYGEGWMKGKEVPAYRNEVKVDADSNVETFVAVKFYIDNWRWKNVPVYVRTGKRMNAKETLITVQFKEVPHYAFQSDAVATLRPNTLTFSIQPQTDIRIRIMAKRPGVEMLLNPVDMVFSYSDAYKNQEPEAYETLLKDVIEGSQTLFMRADQVEAAWKVISPILESWQNNKAIDFPNYSSGSWGPADADALIARDGKAWINMTETKR